MKKMPVTAKVCLYATAVLTLVGVILRTVAMFTCFDSELGYFNSADASLPTVLTVLSFATVLSSIILSIATPKGTLPDVWPEPRHNAIAAIPFALFGVAGAWHLWMAVSAGLANKLLLIAGLLAMLSALYYISTATKASVLTVSALGLLPILWGLISVAETYTDQFTTMNSPIKLGLQFGLLGVMLATTAELRFRLGKSAPRAALCFHSIAVFLCFTGSIPVFVAILADQWDQAVHAPYALALMGAGIYIAFRFAAYFFASAPQTVAEGAVACEAADTPAVTADDDRDSDNE